MKITIILLSILTGVATWWWQSRLVNQHPDRSPGKLRRFLRSLLTVVIVYFGLMSIVMIWLLMTT